MLILYITYVNMSGAASGSGVRPQKMYRAFLDEGHEVKLLAGNQNRSDWPRRREAIREIMRWLDTHTPDLCYIESPVYPILLTEDCRLIRRLHHMGVPTGYFYRDFYWKFPELYPHRRSLTGRLKDCWMDCLQRRTDSVLRCADIVYFPSEECKAYFSYADMRTLPPAGEIRHPERCPEKNTCIYVGGISADYGGEMMLQAFRRLNGEGKKYSLLLVCRENEWNAIRGEWDGEPWLEVHHTSGDGLLPLYARAEAALLPIQKNPYTDLSVNVKIYEYMSFGLPVVSTNVEAVAKIVRENRMGVAAPSDTAEDFAAAVETVLADKKLAEYGENGLSSMCDRNLWIHRVRQLTDELRGKK